MNNPAPTHPLRKPCANCGNTTGHIDTRNGQDCLFCTKCQKWQYNAPRTETGRPTRSHRTRPDIPATQRARILDRDNATCVVCHRQDTALDAGHLLSVDQGRQLGLTDAELYDDENLAAMCSACNSGYSNRSVNPRLFIAVIRARTNKGRA